jgi:hypothetical protein
MSIVLLSISASNGVVDRGDEIEIDRVYTIYLPNVKTSVRSKGVGSTYERCEELELLGVSWFYDWSENPPECGKIVSTPMIWGREQVGRELGGSDGYVMGFNEPELESQSNITPQEGAELWRRVEELYGEYRLVSPGCLSISWLDEMWEEYVERYDEEPRFDALAAHCYGNSVRSSSAVSWCKAVLEEFISWARDKGVREVWLTEYAFLPCLPEGIDGSVAFMRGMREYVDREDMITRDAWFQLTYRGDESWAFGEKCNTSLVWFDDGGLTRLGIEYLVESR